MFGARAFGRIGYDGDGIVGSTDSVSAAGPWAEDAGGALGCIFWWPWTHLMLTPSETTLETSVLELRDHLMGLRRVTTPHHSGAQTVPSAVAPYGSDGT